MTGFASRDAASLQASATTAVELAGQLGADGASASARAGGGISIRVRDGRAESAVRDGYQSLALTVYRGGRSGTASTVALEEAAIARAVREAVAIADAARADPDAGLADPDTLAFSAPVPDLFAPSCQSPEALLAQALALEAHTRDAAERAQADVRPSEASVASSDHVFALATSAGFSRAAAASIHSQWTTVLARRDTEAARDHAQSVERRFEALVPPVQLAEEAVARATAQLGARSVPGARVPVLFDARIAATLVHALAQALFGRSQYSKASWLPGALGTTIAASHLDLVEDPFEPFGLASGAWDSEGVAGSRRHVVEAGTCTGYFLNSVSARRLAMRSTGNADGPWNLTLASRATGGDAAALRRMLGRGLIVTQLQGGGSDPVTGNWTQAVAGFWVEGGTIVHPVIDVTIGGRLADIWRSVVAVGDDVQRHGAVRTGSILVDAMQVGGRA